MLILSNTTDNVQVVLGGAVTANQLDCYSSWRDNSASSPLVPGRTVVATNSTTDVNVVPAPASSTYRIVDSLSVYNRDTAAATVTVKFDANGTEYTLWKGSLSPGERVSYDDGAGWTVTKSTGALKVTQSNDAPTVNTLNTVVLSSDVVNDDAVANTLYDVTGLSFSVLSGGTYWFRFCFDYTSAITTTGSRWTVNGPAATRLAYTTQVGLGATTFTLGTYAAYEYPVTSNSSSPTTSGNVAFVEGFVTPYADGTVIGRFASEVAGSAVTAKAGSILQYMRVL